MASRRWLSASVLLLGAAIAALVAHGWSYLPFFPDDAFISLRYAQRFSLGEGLTWNDGERVEGYSNFLWVLLLGAIGTFQTDGLIQSARVLGVLAAAITMMALHFAHRPGRFVETLPVVAGTSALAVSGTVAAYSIGGLEHPLLLACVAWGIVTLRPVLEQEQASLRALLVPGSLFGLACLTRPDGFLFVGAVGVACLVAGRFSHRSVRTTLLLGLVPAGLMAAHTAFRLAYYDDWAPNTYHAKFALASGRTQMGLTYLWDAVPYNAPYLLVLAIGAAVAIRVRSFRSKFALVAIPFVTWSAYVVVIGGDLFPQRRHVYPLVVLAAMLWADLAAWAVAVGGSDRRKVAAWALSAIALVGLGALQWSDPARPYAKAAQWNWAGQPIGLTLRNAFGEQRPLLGVDAAGTLPYFARLPTLDMLGINDRRLAKERPEGFGEGVAGHELGSADYVLERGPDIIVFHTYVRGDTPYWNAGTALVRRKEFQRNYQRMSLDTGGEWPIQAALWVRREGSPLGIVRSPKHIRIPGYLMAHAGDARATPSSSGQLVTRIQPGQVAHILGLELPPGTWRVRVEGNPAHQLWLRSELRGFLFGHGTGEMKVRITEHWKRFRLRLQPVDPEATGTVTAVTFDLVGGAPDRPSLFKYTPSKLPRPVRP